MPSERAIGAAYEMLRRGALRVIMPAVLVTFETDCETRLLARRSTNSLAHQAFLAHLILQVPGLTPELGGRPSVSY